MTNLGEGMQDAINNQNGTNENAGFLESIPQEYRDKPYMQGVTSMESILKQLDGAQKFIGAPKLPTQESSAEEWNKLYKHLGRPDSADGYEIPLAEGASDQDKNMNSKFKDLFFKNNLSADAAKGLYEGYSEILNGLTEQQATAKAASKEAYENKLNEIFGSDREASVKAANSLFDKYAPAELKGVYENLDPSSKAALAAVLKGVSDEYISQDDVNAYRGGSKPGAPTLRDAATIREELANLRKNPDFSSPFESRNKSLRDRYHGLMKELDQVLYGE